MALITLRILDGPGRGMIYHQIITPVTIGREEGNAIQLNDERVSRFHLRITDDEGTILLSDLQSTNGTRINGESVHLWALRPGDLISIGRSQILVGSAQEIANRLNSIRKEDIASAARMGGDEIHFLENALFSPPASPSTTSSTAFSSSPFEAEIFRGMDKDSLGSLHLLPPPQFPKGLQPKQSSQILELLHYIHLRLRYLVTSVSVPQKENKDVSEDDSVILAMHQWQNLLDLYGRVALLLHSVTEP
ncbi:MAG TPA: FHA domain-containing protein [Planctomycetaceae bacterium]|nr:FHA domain-containing protein [Planctomycetaceae bacterium]